MQYTRLGSTGLEVSRICLGCMTFGEPGRGNHPWTLPAEQSRPIIRHAVEAGINFFDTANAYSDGSSEEIVGAALREFLPRDEVVIATKVFNRMKPGPNGAGLSRKAILHEIDQSLRRLGTDYVDLYQIHRWDHATPIEETLEALHDVVKAGKARYIGAFDERGRLLLLGRVADVIKTGGYRVNPDEIEALLTALPGCGAVCVAGLPSEYWGEIVMAVAEGASDGWQEQVMERVTTLSRHKHPRLLLSALALPRNAQGKISRRELVRLVLATHQLADGPHPVLSPKPEGATAWNT